MLACPGRRAGSGGRAGRGRCWLLLTGRCSLGSRAGAAAGVIAYKRFSGDCTPALHPCTPDCTQEFLADNMAFLTDFFWLLFVAVSMEIVKADADAQNALCIVQPELCGKVQIMIYLY